MRKPILGILLGLALLLTMSASALAASDNSYCLKCHGKPDLKKDVAGETVPLYVDAQAYAKEVHGFVACVDCHTDITEYPHTKATKTYGGWARFSKKDADTSKTRNYYTAASMACTKCHTAAKFQAFATSEHRTIPHQRGAKEVKLTGTDGKEYLANEAFIPADCNRCHLSCGTCHFDSQIKQKKSGDPTELWTKYDAESDKAKSDLTEYGMDWTANVRSHKFRTAQELTNSIAVCQSCHIGYYQGDKSIAAINISGMGVRRHPQVQELQLSGARGVHETLQVCTDCHRGLHEMSLKTTEHGKRVGGDVQCADCHRAEQRKLGKHTKVNCVACHDTELPTVQIDSETKTVEPVALKHKLSESWPSHNLTREVKCEKCHFAGNKVGAPEKVEKGPIHK